MKIKLGIVGVGYWGVNYCRLLQNNDEAELSIACDTNQGNIKKINKQFPKIETTTNLQDVLESDVNAVIVSTPVSSHYDVVKKCLNAGKHVLCEKPVTYSSSQSEELAQLADNLNLTFLVGHIFEYNWCVNFIKNKLAEDLLGDILYIHFKRTGLSPIRADVNAMWDLTSHDVAMAINIIGTMPFSVSAFGQSYLQNGIEDVVFLSIEFPNRVIVSTQASWVEPIKQRLVTIVGKEKMLVFDDVALSEKIRIYDKGISYQPATAELSEFQLSIRDGDIHIPRVKYGEPLKSEMNDFISCIRNKKTPLSDGWFGHKVVKVLEAAQRSLKNNSERVTIQ